MKEKVTKILLKGGFNQASVDMIIAKNFDYAVSTYPDASPRFIADVISTLS